MKKRNTNIKYYKSRDYQITWKCNDEVYKNIVTAKSAKHAIVLFGIQMFLNYPEKIAYNTQIIGTKWIKPEKENKQISKKYS